MIEPLNPVLYQSLQDTFGHVRVSNEGEPIQVRYRPDWQHRNGRRQAVVVSAGETYYVNCPFCSDTRKRLGISYHWSVPDEETGDDMLHLANCFNEKCISTREVQKKLHALVYPHGNYGRTMKVQLPAASPASAPVAPRRFLLPESVSLAEMPEDHPAIRYLRRRNFDPLRLSKRWGVSYCEVNRAPPGRENRPYFNEGRIVYPVYAPTYRLDNEARLVRGTRLAGWQARTLKANPPKSVPKYLTARGMKKSELLYGLPQAIKSEGPVVIVEGVTDVWRLGPGAMALFGKSISPAQIVLILKYFPGQPVVVLLDAETEKEARLACQKIRSGRLAAGDKSSVVIAELPVGRKDPGDCTYKEVWNVVEEAVG